MTDDLVKRLREVKDWWREPGRTAEQAADRIEQLKAALRKIADCDVPREHVKIYRKDGVLSKHDGCEHGRPMYEDCDICTADFASAALGEKKDV